MSSQTPLRPSPLSFDSPRPSPFRRQNSSASPSTVRATTPTTSPTKLNGSSHLSPTKASSPHLSPEKASPFVRRPSQNSAASERPSSPFARPTSSLSIPASPSRQPSGASRSSEMLSTPQGSPSREMSRASSRSDTQGTPQASPSRKTSASATEVGDLGPASPELSRVLRLPSPSSAYFDGAPSSPATVQSPSPSKPSQANLRPTAHRTVTSSTSTTIRQPAFTAQPKASTTIARNTGGYNHVPQPLLRSMRESFEVLDSSNSGTVNSGAVSVMLQQLGLDDSSRALSEFFPSSGPPQLNLARYLDTLSAPLAELSHPDELGAAFGAFDVDDSGQIDLAELKDALLHTVPEPGEPFHPMSDREIDSILGEYAGRRAFGAKGLNAGAKKGEVFRYRDFMANVAGGGSGAGGEEAAVGA